MASESSFDIVSEFNMQELRNAVDQVKREISTRYDFKGIQAEVTLTDDDITVIVPDSMKLKAIQDMLLQKLVNRKLSPKILDIKDPEPAAGGNLKQIIKLVKALDQETCKAISKIIKEGFPKAKASIQGDSVRVSSKSRDDLQAVIAHLKAQDLKMPIEFTNYR
jgi:cyclic-di-GMP-binding protein